MRNKRIFVTGASGLLGSEVLKISDGFRLSRNPAGEISFPDTQDEEVVIHCAAKVGGVQANTEYVADFYDDNVNLSMKIFKECQTRNLKLVSMLSTCVYPDSPYVKYPLTEDQLHAGPPHSSNFGYAYAKRMLDVQSRAYRQQHGCNFITVIPNNLYGLNDNYDLNLGHVIPALVRKFHEAKLRGDKSVTIWGTGRPLREFTFARDAAKISLWLAENYEGEDPVNIGNTDQISIEKLAMTISEIIGFKGELMFDSTKLDGQYQKPSSNKKLRELGCKIQYTPLREGLIETISHFQSVYPNVRGVTMKV